nr:hypothetical protein [Clostridia bacterium]
MFIHTKEQSVFKKHLQNVAERIAHANGRSKQVAGALLACMGDGGRQELAELRGLLVRLGLTDLRNLFKAEPGALRLLLSERAAEAFQRVWERCSLYPYTGGTLRRPFRSAKSAMRYLGTNVYLLEKMVNADAFGAIDVAAELRKTQPYRPLYPVLPALMAAEIDEGNAELLGLCKSILYGDIETEWVLRTMIRGLLMSRSAEAHRMVADLLLAAKLQEGLRQAIAETMDEGSREGFLAMLRVILDNDLLRFSSVARALNVSTGLQIPPEKPATLRKCYWIALECLNDPGRIRGYMDDADTLNLYMALWTAAFDEITDAEPLIDALLTGGPKYKKLVALYFASQTQCVPLRNAVALRMLSDGDPEVSCWAIANLFADGAIDGTRVVSPDFRSFADTHTPGQVYSMLRTVLRKLPRREMASPVSVFPWLMLTVTASDVLERMLHCVREMDDPLILDEMLDDRDKMSVALRHGFIAHFLNEPKTEKQKIALVEALGDKRGILRACAKQIVDALPLTQSDFSIIENLLQYKAGDMRKNSIALLLKQSPESLLDTIERLSQSNSENKRLGAMELVAAAQADPSFSRIREQAKAAVQNMDSASPLEKLRLAEATKTDPPVYNADTGFGLYDPKRVYSPVLGPPPEAVDARRMLALPMERLKEVFTGLSELVHAHRDHRYE